MWNEWVLPAVLFVAVAGPVFLILQLINARAAQLRERASGGSSDTLADSQSDLVLGELTPLLAAQIPVREQDREKLEPELRQAGYYGSKALMEYAAVRAILILLPLFLAFAVALFVDRSRIPMVLIIGVVLSALGFSIPRVYINYRASVRKRQIERGLPVAVDLMTLGLSGGQNVITTLGRVARELRGSFPLLAQELEIVRRQAEYSSLPQALNQWADRVGVPEVRNLVAILTQSERLGTDIASGLMEFATNYRTNLRQRADAQANRASFLMLFPTLVGLWVPAAVILVGPLWFEFWQRGVENAKLLQERRSQSQEAQQRIGRDLGSIPGASPR